MEMPIDASTYTLPVYAHPTPGAVAELISALHEGRRAIGDHCVPEHCYATGPFTGSHVHDLVECPACSFIAAYDAAITRVRGGAL